MRRLLRLLGFRRPLYHWWFLLVLVAAPASAQVAPGVFTTVKSTSTAATSVCVGCPTGTTTPAANSGLTAATVVLPSGVPSSTTNKLYSSAGALFFNGLALATGGSINGTANTVAKFTAATVLGDSIITDNGTTVTIAGATQSNTTVTSGTNGANGAIIVNGPAGSSRIVTWRTAGVVRWVADTTSVAETGANAGSNFRLDAYNDAGSSIGSAIFITRATMAVMLGQNLTVVGTSALGGATTVATSFQLTGAAPVYLGNVNNGYLFRNAANGATLFGITDAGVGSFGGAITITGVATLTAQPILSSLTASLPVFTDASKGLVSNAMTGTGNVVMSAGPTLTGTIGAASMTLSGTLGVTGVATLTAQPILSSLTASQAVFTDGSKGLVSNAITGTGNVVMSASPTLTGTIGAAAMTLSGTLGVSGLATFTSTTKVAEVGLTLSGFRGFEAFGATNLPPNFFTASAAWGTGAIGGAALALANNTSGAGAAGCISFFELDSTVDSFWVDTTGVVRVRQASGCPTENGANSDTGGTVVGTQTSTRAVKRIYGPFTDNARALRTILSTPLYDFDYKSGAYNHQRFVGITTDDSPLFGMDLGRSFNPITAFGFTVAAFKAQANELAALRARVTTLEKR